MESISGSGMGIRTIYKIEKSFYPANRRIIFNLNLFLEWTLSKMAHKS